MTSQSLVSTPRSVPLRIGLSIGALLAVVDALFTLGNLDPSQPVSMAFSVVILLLALATLVSVLPAEKGLLRLPGALEYLFRERRAVVGAMRLLADEPQRSVQSELARERFAAHLHQRGSRVVQIRWPVFQVVRVGGDDARPAALDQHARAVLRGFAELAEE